MATRRQSLVNADAKGKQPAQLHLKTSSEEKKDALEGHHSFHEALHEEFHQVWEDTIRPALEQLKDTTDELLHRFSDFEDDFRGYLRDREPEVDVQLIEEIYWKSLKSKTERN